MISSLTSGGAERVLSLMANYWAEREHSITLLTLADPKCDFYAVDHRVTRVGLGLTHSARNPFGFVANNFERVRCLRRAVIVSRPDVVISFVDKMNMVTLLATLGLSIPVIVSERIDPRHHPIGKVWTVLRRLLYPRASAVVVQTEAVAQWARSFLPSSVVQVIANPVRVPDVSPRPRGCTIMAMGRLVHQKGFDVLLRAFARCHKRFPDWRLLIIGEGEERKTLEAMAGELRITSAIELVGRLSHPETALSQAGMFVMPSRYEGFPNALLEAMSLGLPVISTDCPSGPSDIIRHGINGLLVPSENSDALANAIEALIENDQLRTELAMMALEVRNRFSLGSIMAKWDDLLKA